MKIKIARLLLGKDINAILNQTEKYKNDAFDYEKRITSLLQERDAINRQKIDLERREHDIRIQLDAIRGYVEQKRDLCMILDEINKKEDEIRKLKKGRYDSILDIINLRLLIAHSHKEIKDIKAQKTTLEDEKREHEDEASQEDKTSDELQSINTEIVGLQNWLRIHSADLTQIESDIIEFIRASEEEDEPKEVPQDDILEEDEETKTEHEEGITIALVEPNIKKEPDEGKSNDSVEPHTHKQRDHKIKEIFDIETGETINAEEFFKKPIRELESWRAIFQQCISQNNRRFVCPKCLEMIRISGRGDERGVPAIFTHKNDSVLCKKTTTGQSEEDINRKKYGLFGQSLRHKNLKKELFDRLSDRNSLSLGVRNVEMEKRVYSSLPFFSWRQPDIQIDYQNYKIVFEIQLSTTFLSVITERDTFYRLNDYYIIWIFNFDDNRKYVDLNNLAMKDIYFANKLNAFIFDDEAKEWSRESGQLVLKCNWVEPDSTWHYANTEKHFGGERVTLDQLKFDHDTHKLYFHDAETPYFEQHPDIARRLSVEIKSKEYYIRELEQKAQEKEIRKQEAIELMMKDGDCMIPFEVKKNGGKRYGFKYGVTVIIEPKFTSYEEREDGSFIVGYGLHKGLVNQYGEMIRKCEFINIIPLSGSAYLAEDRDSFWLGNMKRSFRERKAGDKVVSKPMNEKVEKVSLYHKDEEESFSSFYVIDGKKFFAQIGYRTIFVDLEGNKIVEEEFSKMRFVLDKNLMHVQRKGDGKWNDLDYDGNYMYDWTIYEDINQLSEGLRIGRVHTEGRWPQQERIYYDIIDAKRCIITGNHRSISLWTENIIKIGDYNCAYLVDMTGKRISSSFRQIGDLENGKAKVISSNRIGYIDEKGQPIPEKEIQLANGSVKYLFMGKWGVRNSKGQTTLECSYDEITTYHGYYYVIVDKRITKTNWKTTNTIPVKGIKTRETDKTIVFNVGGKDFLIPRTIAAQYWKDNTPESADLIIKNFHKDTPGRGWSGYTQLNVYAKPYCQRVKKPHAQVEFAVHESVKGIISWVQYGSAIVKLLNKKTIFVHKSNFRGLSLDKTYKGREIEIKKVGVNEEHNKDVWEIVSIAPTV